MISFQTQVTDLDIKVISKILLIAAIACLCWIPIDYYWIGITDRALQAGKRSGGGHKGNEFKRETLEPLTSYQRIFEKGSLFGSFYDSEEPVMQTVPLSTLIKDYRLKGIILSQIPEAIVEDARTQKTIFVHPGDSLDLLKVKGIYEGYVVLSDSKDEIKLEIT